jgi:hypothetical protein
MDTHIRLLLVRAESLCRRLAEEFTASNFTDRHDDGPRLLRLADDIKLTLDKEPNVHAS